MGCTGSRITGSKSFLDPGIASLPLGDVPLKFVVRCKDQRVGLRVGHKRPRVHDPYRCRVNGGGVQGEYGQANTIQICSPADAMSLTFSRTHPHVDKLLDEANPTRCINVYWWKLQEGTRLGMYDAYPSGPATGMRYSINADGTISVLSKRHLVLGLRKLRNGSTEVLHLVEHDSPLAIQLELPGVVRLGADAPPQECNSPVQAARDIQRWWRKCSRKNINGDESSLDHLVAVDATPQVAAAPATRTPLASQLRELAATRDQGLLSEGEFNDARKEVIAQFSNS